MTCIVCTGGIGSGKSYTVNIMAAMGIPVYISDIRAKDLYETDEELINSVRSIVGDEIILNGKIDRALFAERIFSNRYLLERVVSVVHPAVLKDFEMWKRERSEAGDKVVVFESAIFVEAEIFHHIADIVLVVSAPLDIRVKRVMRRDGLSHDQVLKRMANQVSEEQRLKMADFVIFADGKRAILPQIVSLLSKI